MSGCFDLVPAFLGPIGLPEMIMIGIIGLLLFGNRLPSVGRSLGKGIVEFKRGLRGIKDDMDEAMEEQEDKEKGKEKEQQRQTETKALEDKNASTPTDGKPADGKPAEAAAPSPTATVSSTDASPPVAVAAVAPTPGDSMPAKP